MKIVMKDYFNLLEFKNFNIVYGGNGSGKTEIYNEMISGFLGQLKDKFLVNGEVVLKNQFKVFDIGENDSFSEEMKLGSKSYLKKEIEKRIEESFDKELESIQKDLEQNIKSKFLHEFSYLDKLELDFKLNLNELVIKNISFKTEEKYNYSFSKLRKLKLEMILNQELDRNTVILIDHFDLGLSKHNRSQMINRLKEIAESKDCTIILFSSNFIDFGVNDKFIVQKFMYKNILDIVSEELIQISKSDLYLYSEEELESLKIKIINEKIEIIKEYLEKNQKSIEIN